MTDDATEAAVRRLLTQYCRGVDRCDVDLIEACFHPNAILEYGAFNGSPSDFAPWATEWIRSRYAATVHTIGNITASPVGDRVRVEAQVRAIHLPDGEGDIVVFCGRYLDVFTERDGQYRISHRRVVSDVSGRIPWVAGTPMGAPSGRNSSDASYRSSLIDLRGETTEPNSSTVSPCETVALPSRDGGYTIYGYSPEEES